MKNVKYFIYLWVMLGAPLFGAPSPKQESLALQELRLELEQAHYQINHYKTEVDLLSERIQTIEKAMSSSSKNLKTEQGSDKRLVTLEKNQELLLSDLKLLKNRLTEETETVQNKISKIESQLSTDIRTLKQTMQNMLALLQKEEKTSYTVKAGDSLGQIALDYKTDVTTLKKLNNLTTDTIFSGQKLLLP